VGTSATHTYLNELTRRLDNILASRAGVYLIGSAAVGAYRPGASDLDVIAAADAVGEDAVEAILARCSHEALPCPARKLELVVYEWDALARPGERPRWTLNFDTGKGERHVGRDPVQEPPHWFVLDLAFARRHAVTLAGPPATDAIGAIPDELIRSALADAVAWYAEHEPGEPARLAARRARHWQATGEFATKLDVS
jgi:hypothetical protein